MTEQYYRVKVQWPIPHCLESVFEGNVPTVHGICDSRFYTTATDLRSVYLDIQAHLAKNYAPEGLNEHEDTDVIHTDPVLALQAYSYMRPVVDFEVDVINDPEQVQLIRDGLELVEHIRNVLRLIAQGLVPTRGSWMTAQIPLGDTVFNLDRTIRQILQWYSHDDDLFAQLRELVDKANGQVLDLSTYAREVIIKGKAE